MTLPFWQQPPANSSFGPLPSDSNLLGWTFDSAAIAGGSLLGSAGVIRGSRVRTGTSGLCTGMLCALTAVGAALTAGQNFGALFDSNGNFLAQTIDLSALWVGALGSVICPWTTPIANLPAGKYYVGAWWNGTTAPTLGRGGGAVVNPGESSGIERQWAGAGGLTNTAPPSIATAGSTGLLSWFALY